jgi:hypothetical protein
MLFATELWPPARVRMTGLSGAASSRSKRSGPAFLFELILGPSVACHPLAFPQLLGLRGDGAEDLRQRARLRQIDGPPGAAAHVDVGVVESRHRHLPLEVDDPRGLVGIEKIVSPDGDDLPILHYHRLVDRERFVGGDDLAVVKQEVRGLLRPAGPDQEKRKKDDAIHDGLFPTRRQAPAAACGPRRWRRT